MKFSFWCWHHRFCFSCLVFHSRAEHCCKSLYSFMICIRKLKIHKFYLRLVRYGLRIALLTLSDRLHCIHFAKRTFKNRTIGASNSSDRMSATVYDVTTLPKNMVSTRPCWMCIVPFRSNDIAICVTGCTKYAQYVKRLSGSMTRSDSSLSIGPARPHLHDSTTHTSASPQANLKCGNITKKCKNFRF